MNLSTWNEAYDWARSHLSMTEEEAEAFATAHFANPDAVVEELHAEPVDALTGVVTPEEAR